MLLGISTACDICYFNHFSDEKPSEYFSMNITILSVHDVRVGDYCL